MGKVAGHNQEVAAPKNLATVAQVKASGGKGIALGPWALCKLADGHFGSYMYARKWRKSMRSFSEIKSKPATYSCSITCKPVLVAPQGAKGVAGVRGLKGEQGTPGKPGSPGEAGDAGKAGPNGSDGADGPQGSRGRKGRAGH